ncbi:MAG: hypothetical protein EAX96_14930 [Candidatus Lokiarchaeota archaeon]|nr:hypothetical protein [Candidatus Lokiarchaeota archaeon]
MLGNLSDEETNNLILYLSENIRKGLIGRSVVESQLFPVTHYISTACYILYLQGFQNRILKEIVKKIQPEEIGRRSKTLGSYLNQLAFHSIAMLYLHGRAQHINDMKFKMNKGEKLKEPIENEEKIAETKFMLDFWKRLSPNYRNDKKLTADDGGNIIQILSDKQLDKIKDDFIVIKDKSIMNELKKTSALLTNQNFLSQAECRAGIFEHGPYTIDNSKELIFFKEFQFLYSGESLGGIEVSDFIDHLKTSVKSPISNLIFGFSLKNMEEVKFNDWGTSFFKPPDYTLNINKIAIWTKDYTHPKDFRAPDKLGEVIPLKFEILKELQDYAQKSLNELYLKMAKWNFMKKLMTGTNVYTNFLALYAAYAGIENEFNWKWVLDILENKQNNDMVNVKDVLNYIEKLKVFPHGAHPFLARYFRTKKSRKTDPTLYYIQR